jgi:hypothetical protein
MASNIKATAVLKELCLPACDNRQKKKQQGIKHLLSLCGTVGSDCRVA